MAYSSRVGNRMNRTDTTDALTFAELAAKAGLPGRTIRFYIAKGLLPGPVKAGRGATYGKAHLETLRSIKASQAPGSVYMNVLAA